MGETVERLDDLAKSALRELANMVAGTARSYLNRDGVVAEITSPVFLEGNGHRFDGQPATIDLTLDQGAIRLIIGIHRKGEH